MTRNDIDRDLARVMRIEGGLSWRELAEAFGCSATAIRYAVDDVFHHHHKLHMRRKYEPKARP